MACVLGCVLNQSYRRLRRIIRISVHQESYGTSGTIKDAGGVFAERQKAKENQYFYNLQKQQLEKLKHETDKKIEYHRAEIDKHMEAIKKEVDSLKDHQG